MFPPHGRYALEALNPDGFLALRPAGQREGGAHADFLCEYANPAAEALMGDSPLGRPLLARWPELSEVRDSWLQTLATGAPGTRLLSLGSGANTRTVRARTARVEEGLLAVWLSDVTDAERLASEAAVLEERMRSFVECLPSPFIALDRQCRIVYVNRESERLLGQRRHALLGHSLWEAYPEPPRSMMRAQVQRALATGAPVDFEEHSPTLHLEVTVVPGGPGLLLYLHDVTARYRDEEAARRTSALFQAVLQGTTDAIYTKDLSGRYTRINPAGARLLGLPVEEVVGRTDAELWPPELAHATLNNDRQVLAFRQTFTYEEQQSGPQRRVWLSTKGVLRDETGIVFGLFGISRDITDLKLLEESLRDNEARVLEALESAGLTLWDLRMPEERLRWVRGAAAHFSLKVLEPEEPLEAFLARVHPEDRLRVAGQLTQCVGSPGEVSLEYRVRSPDGPERRHALRGRVSVESVGRSRLLGVVVDLTHQARSGHSEEAA
jgi:PAS domain S-box-containing protein